jgi:hypothetical protein
MDAPPFRCAAALRDWDAYHIAQLVRSQVDDGDAGAAFAGAAEPVGLDARVAAEQLVDDLPQRAGPEALEALIHVFSYTFPIGVDQPGGDSGLPQTMRAYGMRGTPSLILIDHQGHIRKHSFGHEDDLRVGANIATLVSEAKAASIKSGTAEHTSGTGCDQEKCSA